MTEIDSAAAGSKDRHCPSEARRKPSARKIGEASPPSRTVGRQGEDLAAHYLEREGCQILARNWRSPSSRNEIDLIVRDGGCIAFVEVKMARTEKFGDPLNWITPRKQAAVIKAALAYLSQWNDPRTEFRFDAVAITPSRSSKRWEICHIKGAFTCDVADDL